MNRRIFAKKLGLASAFLGTYSLTSCSSSDSEVMDRLAMSTVNFRERFSQTWSEEQANKQNELTLLDIPAYFKERFQLTHVEFWSKHFESIEMPYLLELKEALAKSGSNLINIQFDEAYQLGATDENERNESLALALDWLDAAETLGADCFRVNPGGGDVNHVIAGMKIINEAAKEKGLVLMVENHFGIEMNPDIHLEIVEAVGQNCYTLPDFGNYDNDKRFDSLQKIMPYAHQISAKTMAFDANMQHTSYDFDLCMQIAIDYDFKGIYSVEQWSPNPVEGNEELMADWMLERIKQHIA